MQRKIEARSSDDSFTGLVRTLYFADTFLSDSELHKHPLNVSYEQSLTYPEFFFIFNFYINFLLGAHNTPSLWAGTNGGCVFAYMLRLPNVEHRADEPVTAQQGENIKENDFKSCCCCFVFF